MNNPAEAFATIDVEQLTGATGAGLWKANKVYDSASHQTVDYSDFKERYGDVCRRNSCFDSHSGHFLGRDEWNERQIDRQSDRD